MDLESLLRTIPDFPKPGIQFKDISPLLGSPEGLKSAVDQIVSHYKDAGINKVAAIDARGFILGGALAYQLGIGFIPVRKVGKLPGDTIAATYKLEYDESTLEIQRDALVPGESVLLFDDLIATGGSAIAAIELLNKLDASVKHAAFMVDLPDLGGSAALGERGVETFSLCEFAG